MISPHDVEMVVVHQSVHDEMCTRTSVEDVSEKMEPIDCEALNQSAQFDNECICTVGFDDGFYDFAVVFVFFVALVPWRLMQEFLDNVVELFW